jgi:broad specificity phosphatase PhoE
MPTRVILLRHAESANPRIFHGAESDIGLSERGLRQAEAIAPILAEFQPKAVVTSAMRRARETAGPLARVSGLPVREEPDLHERRVGALSGTPTGLADGLWPQTLARWLAGEVNYAPPGAESFDAIRLRVMGVWDRLTTDLAGKTMIVVGHGVVCRVLLLNLIPGFSVADWHRLGPIANVGLSELVREDAAGRPWRALRVNEVPHVIRGI